MAMDRMRGRGREPRCPVGLAAGTAWDRPPVLPAEAGTDGRRPPRKQNPTFASNAAQLGRLFNALTALGRPSGGDAGH